MITTAACRAHKDEKRPRPLFQSRVPAGFPSPSGGHVEASLDLSRELIVWGAQEHVIHWPSCP